MTDQVLIESRIVIATDTFARELGAKFGISGSRDNVYFSGSLASSNTTDAVLGRSSAANAIGSDFSGSCWPCGPIRSNL